MPSGDLRRDASQDEFLMRNGDRTASASRQNGFVKEVDASQAQFDEEVFGHARTHGDSDRIVPSDLPTSDMNRAAELQLQREAGYAGEVGDDDQEASERVRNIHRATWPDGIIDEEPSVPNVQSALTEANLASQQAMHRERLLRGTDLPPDEDDVRDGQRQDDFANYLKGLLRWTQRQTLPELRMVQPKKPHPWPTCRNPLRPI